jgi:hypothetical protein
MSIKPLDTNYIQVCGGEVNFATKESIKSNILNSKYHMN